MGDSNSQGPQRLAPRDEIIEHRVDGGLLLRTGSQGGEMFEIGLERQSDLGSDSGNLDLAHDQSQMFDSTSSAD